MGWHKATYKWRRPSMLVASVLPCVGSQVWLLKNPFSDPFGPVKVCSNMFGCVFVVQVHISSHQKSDIVSLHPKKNCMMFGPCLQLRRASSAPSKPLQTPPWAAPAAGSRRQAAGCDAGGIQPKSRSAQRCHTGRAWQGVSSVCGWTKKKMMGTC